MYPFGVVGHHIGVAEPVATRPKPGRKIGVLPTVETGEPLCDGFLWLKRPDESDGECKNAGPAHQGPKAGVWWEERALELAQ